MSMPDPSPLKPQDAVMFTLGKLEGKVDAVLSSQHEQAAVNAENKREHDEFRKQLGDHAEILAVLRDDKNSHVVSRGEALTKAGIFVAAAAAVTGAIISTIYH